MHSSHKRSISRAGEHESVEPTTRDPAGDPATSDAAGDSTANNDLGVPSGAGFARWKSLLTALTVAVIVVGVIVVAAVWPDGAAPDAGTAGGPAADTPPLLADVGRRDPMPLPDATLPALADLGPAEGIDLAELHGEPAILNFWASWCGPCVNEMPAMQRVADDTGIRVIGIDYVDQNDKGVALARKLGITYDLVRDDDGDFGRKVGLIGTPTTLFVDSDGTIVRQLAAELSEEQIRETIDHELR